MKTYVINLDRRPDRLAEIGAELGRIGLDFERVAAVDARRVPMGPLVSSWKAWIYSDLSPVWMGQVGCYASHRLVWQRMLDDGVACALVFEDDAMATDWDPAILNFDLKAAGLDQLRLEGFSIIYGAPLQIGPPEIKVLDRNAVTMRSYGTACYMITDEGARKALAVGKFWFHVDHFDMWAKIAGLRSALLQPTMFKQSTSDSDILGAPKSPVPQQLMSQLANVAGRILHALIWPIRDLLKNHIIRKNERLDLRPPVARGGN